MLKDEESKYPQIQPGGSLMLAWQVRNRRVLVVGGGDVRNSLHMNSHFVSGLH